MISQWWRVFISPQKKPRPKNNDKSPHMSHLKQVAKMGSLILVVRFRPRCRGIMWNSPTKIVAGSNLSNLAPLDVWRNLSPEKPHVWMFFSGTWKCFCVALMHVLRNYWKIVFLDHTCFEAPPKWKYLSMLPISSLTSWPQYLNLCNCWIMRKRLESNIYSFETGHFKSSNPDSWVVTLILVMSMSPRDLYWHSG